MYYEVGRRKALSLTLNSETSAKGSDGQRVMLFLLMLISVLFSALFLSTSPPALISVLTLTVTYA